MLALEYAQPIVLGVSSGAALGLVAIGLVLIYKSSGVFNFAAGEFVTLSAFGVYIGESIWDLPVVPSVIVGLLFGVLAGLFTERVVVRPLADRPRVTIL